MKSLATCIVALALAALSGVASSQTYAIVDLGVGSPFDETLGYGLNQHGQVTGTGYIASTGELHAFIYNNGLFQDLGMLGYPYGADGVAINNSGQLAATGYGPGYRALLYSNGHPTPLGSIDGGSSEGLSINSLGHIVGRAINGDGGGQGFTYIGGHFAALNVDRAASINDLDQYVGSIGYSWVQFNYVHVVEHAFLFSGGTLTDLGNLGGGVRTNTEAEGINNLGQVVGYSTLADGTIHAFLYSAGFMQDLGTIAPYNTYATAINNHGQVVGNIETYVGGQIGTFLYSNGVMHNIADLLDTSGIGWDQLTAFAINDNGWIVGYGTLNGDTHGFIIKPKKPTPLPIKPGPWGG